MRRLTIALAALAVAAPGAAAQPQVGRAQDLATRLQQVRDGSVRLSFPTRADVCGDGRFIGQTTASGFRTIRAWRGGYSVSESDVWAPDCRKGPLRLVVVKAGGRVVELRAAVGVEWLPNVEIPDLGMVPAAEAAEWLLDQAATADGVGSVAFLAASVADGARIADRLMRMAKDRGLRSEVRERAIRWVNEVAAREAKAADADRLLRGIAADDGEVADVRERAIRELRPTQENDAYLKGLYRELAAEDLKERIIRRLGESEGDADWLEGIALDAREASDLRERALRVIGERPAASARLRWLYGRLDSGELKERIIREVGESAGDDDRAWLREVALDRGEREDLRDRALRMIGERDRAAVRELYDRLDRPSLKERALRIAGERADAETRRWLMAVAIDAAEPTDARERAIRILAEEGAPSSDLGALYDRLDRRELRERTVRLLGERGDDAAVDKLIEIARKDPDRELRRSALRRLAESGNPKARSALEDVIRGG